MIPHIHRRSFGSGPRPVLAIHCSLAHSVAWRGLANELRDQCTIHAYDLPCHGKSGDWDGQGVMHDTATDMARAVLDDLGPQPIDVIGHSFGGTVALRLAIEAPDRLRRAVLYEPVYFAPAMADDPTFVARYVAATADYDAAMAVGDRVAAARAFNRAWGDGERWEKIPAATRQYMVDRIQFVRDSAPFLVDDSAGLLATGRFDQAQVPVLLMAGAQSPWAAEVNAAIARRLPLVETVTLPGQGHMAPITAPDVVAPHVAAFLHLPQPQVGSSMM